MLSKDPDKPEDGWISGPRIHEFMQEMHREVFAGREETILTVGEMPDVTPEDAQLFTDPARRGSTWSSSSSTSGSTRAS